MKVFLDQIYIKSRYIRRKEDGISTERQCGSLTSAKIMTKSGIKQLVKLFDHKCEIIQRKVKLSGH